MRLRRCSISRISRSERCSEKLEVMAAASRKRRLHVHTKHISCGCFATCSSTHIRSVPCDRDPPYRRYVLADTQRTAPVWNAFSCAIVTTASFRNPAAWSISTCATKPASRASVLRPLHTYGRPQVWAAGPACVAVLGSLGPARRPITETNRIHLVLFGIQNRTCGPHLAATRAVLLSAMGPGASPKPAVMRGMQRR
jgi:hypothetical protein